MKAMTQAKPTAHTARGWRRMLPRSPGPAPPPPGAPAVLVVPALLPVDDVAGGVLLRGMGGPPCLLSKTM
ncbi:hypothetical protein GCM10009714_21430 [Microlunatus capsulatus]